MSADERFIIHINVADFAVAVERMVDARLRARPVVIAPQGAARGAVYDMSEEAYQSGVRKGMPLGRALCRCPDAVVLAPHPERYERGMRLLLRHARPYAPRVEMTDHQGHLFLDLTGTGRLWGAPCDVAGRIRRAVRDDMGVAPVWSVAPSKLVAKVATRVVKPAGDCIVRAGEEEAFLAPLPLGLIPGIAAGDAARLRAFNLTRAGEVAHLSEAQLAVVFGPRGESLHAAVRGIDPSPVRPVGQAPPVVALDHAFADDTNAVAVVDGVVYRLVERAGTALRRRRLAARRVGIVLDYCDGVRVVRQAAVQPATANDFFLFAAAAAALQRAWTRRVGIRHLRLACDRLVPPPAQLELFADDRGLRQNRHDLVAAIDAVRGRFGFDAIRVGRTLSASSS
jgi:DNA polymerase-4